MTTQVAATYADGVFKPDQSVAIPERTRVTLTIEPISEPPNAAAAWESLMERLRERPINSGGVRFTRDELHERR